MKIELNGKRVFVTAGGAGLGRATVLAMASLGAEVFTCDINAETLADLPEGVKTFVADVADSAQVDAIFDRILPGGLDILVNNAGVAGPTKLVEDVSNEEWRQCMAVCIDAQFYCVRRAVPLFKQQRHGVIINLVSAAGVLGYPTRSPYGRSGRLPALPNRLRWNSVRTISALTASFPETSMANAWSG